MGEKGNVKKFWPIPTDYDKTDSTITPDEIKKRNEVGLEFAKKVGFIK